MVKIATGRDDAFNVIPPSASPYVPEISWGAIIGGAFAAAAVSLILLILGSALGLSSLSPWSHPGSVASFTAKTAIWLIVMQWFASGLGGYLTGRLRTKWVGTHADEVHFRDTAHGFLTWAVATVLTASLLTSAASSVVGGGVHAAATIASGTAIGAASQRPDGNNGDPTTGYYIDSLFRSPTPNPSAPTQDVRGETMRILVMGAKNGNVSDEDKSYLTSLVAARTGLSTADATKRVDDVLTEVSLAKEKTKQDAEVARKTAMHASLYIFLSLLIGAFIASVAAALGGKQRDEY